jgi:hypothetical protein
MTKNELPKPEEGIDFYSGEWCRYTISIDVDIIDEVQEEKLDSEICSKAMRSFREGIIDGSATIVHSEKIKDVKLDCNTGLPFDRKEWEISKCRELELHCGGTPLRPCEKVQPKNQTRLEPFLGEIMK